MPRKHVPPVAMEFPRLAPELDRRRKLMPEDIVSLAAYRKGHTIAQTALAYGVSVATVVYHTCPQSRATAMARNAKRKHAKTPEERERYNANKRYQRRANYDKVRPYLTNGVRKTRLKNK